MALEKLSPATVVRGSVRAIPGRSSATSTAGEPVIEVRVPQGQVTSVHHLDLLAARDLAQALVSALTEVAVQVEGERREEG